MYVRMHTCVCLLFCACMCVCVLAFACAYVCVCVGVWVWVWVCACRRTGVQCVHPCLCTWIHVWVCGSGRAWSILCIYSTLTGIKLYIYISVVGWKGGRGSSWWPGSWISGLGQTEKLQYCVLPFPESSRRGSEACWLRPLRTGGKVRILSIYC